MSRFGLEDFAPRLLVCTTALCATAYAPQGAVPAAQQQEQDLDREAFYQQPQGTRTDRHVLQDQPGQLNYDNMHVDLFSPQRRVDVMGLGEAQQPRRERDVGVGGRARVGAATQRRGRRRNGPAGSRAAGRRPDRRRGRPGRASGRAWP